MLSIFENLMPYRVVVIFVGEVVTKMIMENLCGFLPCAWRDMDVTCIVIFNLLIDSKKIFFNTYFTNEENESQQS